jgi:hypothetical protein
VAAAVVVVLIGGVVFAWQLLRMRAGGGRGGAGLLSGPVGLVVTGVVTTLAILGTQSLVGVDPVFDRQIPAFVIALLMLGLLAIPAWFVLTARDSRRFAIAAFGAAVLWFIAWYPNLSALPLPGVMAGIYLGALPTYNYYFQFAVNTEAAVPVSFADPTAIGLLFMVAAFVVAALYATRSWRIELARRRSLLAAPEAPA